VSTWQHLVVEDARPITRITLNRPDRRNAMSLDLMRELRQALEDAAEPVVVIDGRGPAFSAGHDLRELVECGNDEAAELFATCSSLMTTVQSIPQPVIAQVHGVATAAGCQLVASCDLAIAATDARFATPGVRIGLFCSTPMVPLTRSIGPKRAMQMLLTGDLIDAATAIDWGLINDAVPPDDLVGAVEALAAKIAEASPMVLALGKRTFYEQAGMPLADAYAVAGKVMTENAATDDAHEGITAFLEKRPPTWTGR
jgi:enoyl-CoA hydratase/carnithine racemase